MTLLTTLDNLLTTTQSGEGAITPSVMHGSVTSPSRKEDFSMRTYGKLREKIKAVYGTIGDFAIAMNKDRSTISNKLNGIVAWTNVEIETACRLLDISMPEVAEYFFY